VPPKLAGICAHSEVVETGATFADNAVLKAVAYAQSAQLLALADDSGLEVEALDGAPGVLSARYAGENATDAERTARLLHNLDSTGDKSRRARFVCAIAIADPNGNLIYASQGICAGHIAARPSGTGGFGYDPILCRIITTKASHRYRPRLKNRSATAPAHCNPHALFCSIICEPQNLTGN
jgi:non-canonical purine NTP pyrophosphatase (RdgB/HAM1 family)